MNKYEENCIFCKIIQKLIPADIVYEDERMIIINDLNPISKKHYLAIPKDHYPDISKMSNEQAIVLGEIMQRLGFLSDDLGLSNGFRLVINKGADGRQSVFHLHIHILGGETLSHKFN